MGTKEVNLRTESILKASEVLPNLGECSLKVQWPGRRVQWMGTLKVETEKVYTKTKFGLGQDETPGNEFTLLS